MPGAAIAWLSSARCPIAASSRFGSDARSSNGSSRSLIRYVSTHSSSDSRVTQAPVLATSVTRPSEASSRNASRTGMRLAPDRAATSSCLIRVPGR